MGFGANGEFTERFLKSSKKAQVIPRSLLANALWIWHLEIYSALAPEKVGTRFIAVRLSFLHSLSIEQSLLCILRALRSSQLHQQIEQQIRIIDSSHNSIGQTNQGKKTRNDYVRHLFAHLRYCLTTPPALEPGIYPEAMPVALPLSSPIAMPSSMVH